MNYPFTGSTVAVLWLEDVWNVLFELLIKRVKQMSPWLLRLLRVDETLFMVEPIYGQHTSTTSCWNIPDMCDAVLHFLKQSGATVCRDHSVETLHQSSWLMRQCDSVTFTAASHQEGMEVIYPPLGELSCRPSVYDDKASVSLTSMNLPANIFLSWVTFL